MADNEGAQEVTALPAQSKPPRDKWDYIELFLRPVSALLTAITIALIGYFTQNTLYDAQIQETKRTQVTQNYRLYSELLSKREDAESALRKDMFSTILKQFFLIPDKDNGQTNVPKRLLKLEMLALNFGDALSLSPLFVELDKDINNYKYPSAFSKTNRARDKNRLKSLARRVSEQQLSALSTGGISWVFSIPLSALDNGSFKWPYNEGDEGELPVKEEDREYSRAYSLNDVDRDYKFTFSNAEDESKAVTVKLEIQVSDNPVIVKRSFKLNYFNFPMVDNTRLSNDQRFALVMTKFSKERIYFSAICFPGKYSSQRDKPFLDDVIHRLRNEAQIDIRNQLDDEE